MSLTTRLFFTQTVTELLVCDTLPYPNAYMYQVYMYQVYNYVPSIMEVGLYTNKICSGQGSICSRSGRIQVIQYVSLR